MAKPWFDATRAGDRVSETGDRLVETIPAFACGPHGPFHLRPRDAPLRRQQGQEENPLPQVRVYSSGDQRTTVPGVRGADMTA